MSEPTNCVIERGVATITLDLPERRNSFGQTLLKSLIANFNAALADDDVRVIVLTNTATTFSAGADLKEDRSTLGADSPTFGDVITLIDSSSKPVVARVAGHAAGGGAALAVACDIAVMVDTARIGITEVRLGIPPIPVAAMLAHRMTPRALFESFMAADMMSASRAAEIGMVNVAVPEADLDKTVAHYVDALLRGSPGSLATIKKAMTEMVGRTASENAEIAVGYEGDTFSNAEAKEGVAAFVEKRDANWVPS